MLLLLMALVGCTCSSDPTVLAAYTEARDAALAEPAPPPADWSPDALLQLSPPLFEALVLEALKSRGTITRELEVARGVILAPSVAVEAVSVRATPACEACLQATITMRGQLRFQAVVRGQVPIEVEAVTVVRTTPERTDGGGWELVAVTDAVEGVAVRVPGIPQALVRLGHERLRGWVERELHELGPKVMGTLPASFPIAAMRLVPAGEGLEVELHTTAVAPAPLLGAPVRVSEGWQLDVSIGSAVSLVRTALFREGPRTRFEVVGVPEAVRLDGSRLTAEGRVWRTSPPGWWRDATFVGELRVELGSAGNEVVVSPRSLEVTGLSEGAMWADPLAAAAEATLLGEVQKRLHRRIGGVRQTEVRGQSLTAEVTEIFGTEGGSVLRVRGSLAVAGAPTD